MHSPLWRQTVLAELTGSKTTDSSRQSNTPTISVERDSLRDQKPANLIPATLVQPPPATERSASLIHPPSDIPNLGLEDLALPSRRSSRDNAASSTAIACVGSFICVQSTTRILAELEASMATIYQAQHPLACILRTVGTIGLDTYETATESFLLALARKDASMSCGKAANFELADEWGTSAVANLNFLSEYRVIRDNGPEVADFEPSDEKELPSMSRGASIRSWSLFADGYRGPSLDTSSSPTSAEFEKSGPNASNGCQSYGGRFSTSLRTSSLHSPPGTEAVSLASLNSGMVRGASFAEALS